MKAFGCQLVRHGTNPVGQPEYLMVTDHDWRPVFFAPDRTAHTRNGGAGQVDRCKLPVPW